MQKIFNKEKMLECVLYIFAFLLPIQTRYIVKAGEIHGGYWEYGTYSLYGADIILILLLVLYLFNNFQFFPPRRDPAKAAAIFNPPAGRAGFQLKLKNNYIWIFIGLIELGAFISIFFAPDKVLAVYVFARLLLGIGLFAVISYAVYDKVKLLFSFLAGIFLQAVLGIWQFFIQEAFASKWLGMAYHSAKELGASVIETNDYERWLRAYGGLDHPNILGGLLVIGSLLLVIAKIKNSKIKNQNYNSKLKILNYFIFYPPANAWHWRAGFLFLIFLTALIFTFSRAAWLALILGFVSLAVILIIDKNYSAQKKLGEIILTGGVLFFILFNIYGNLFLTRLNNNTRLENKSIAERTEYYNNFKAVIKENWLAGVGLGNYTLAEAAQVPGKPSYYYQPVHNTILLIWAETGVLGLIGFIGLLIYSLILNFKFLILKQYQISKCLNVQITPSLIIALFVLLFFDHWWWSLHFGVLLFWFVLGWLNAENHSIINKDNANSAND